jgi:hypothetical protein
VTELHFINIHFSMDYDHIPGSIWSSHITHSSTCNGMLVHGNREGVLQ